MSVTMTCTLRSCCPGSNVTGASAMSSPLTITDLSSHRPNIPIGWLEHVPLRPSTWKDQSAAIVTSPNRHWPFSENIGMRPFPGLGGGAVSPSKMTRPDADAPRPATMATESSAPLLTVTFTMPNCSSSGRGGPQFVRDDTRASSWYSPGGRVMRNVPSGRTPAPPTKLSTPPVASLTIRRVLIDVFEPAMGAPFAVVTLPVMTPGSASDRITSISVTVCPRASVIGCACSIVIAPG